MEKLRLLEDTAETVSIASLCALGKTAPNPVLSTIKYFRSEYEAHIKNKRCPAGVCRDLVTYSIDQEKCKSCGACKKACPYGAISGSKEEPYMIDEAACRKCGACMETCRFGAIKVT
jgi:NAD-dependent dihydropyrimidine dehydrogenase PreA subunit